MRRVQWTKPLSLITAFIFAFGQAVPLASAQSYLRAAGIAANADAARHLGSGLLWGPEGAGARLLGKANLNSLRERIYRDAFAENRALEILGPNAKEPLRLIRLYRQRYFTLYGEVPPESKATLYDPPTVEQLTRARDEIRSLVPRDMPVVLLHYDADVPPIVASGGMGGIAHRALVEFAITQPLKPLVLDLALVEGLLAQGKEGRWALKKFVTNSVASIESKSFQEVSPDVREQVNAQINLVRDRLYKEDTQRIEFLNKRKEAARKGAEQLANKEQRVVHKFNLEEWRNKFFGGKPVPDRLIRAIQTGLIGAVKRGLLKAAEVEKEGGYLVVTFEYQAPELRPEKERLVVDLITNALATLVPSGASGEQTPTVEVPEEIFGYGFAYDIRGQASDAPERGKDNKVTLTPEGASLIGRALGSRHEVGARVLVTGDHRESTAPLRNALIKGLLDVGANVVTSKDYVPTGAASLKALAENFAITVQITGSHNPYFGNGIKITEQQDDKGKPDPNGIPSALFGKELLEVYDTIENQAWRKDVTKGTLTKVTGVVDEYIEKLDAILPPLKFRRVVVDSGNGVGARPMTELLRRRGIEVDELFSEPHPRFPNHPADPSQDDVNAPYEKSGVRYASERILALNAKLEPGEERYCGIVLDGDGDRAAFLDESGRPIPPERLLVALYHRFIVENQNAIKKLNSVGHTVKLALDVRGSGVVKQLIEYYDGVEAEFIPAGYPNHRKFVRLQIAKIRELALAHGWARKDEAGAIAVTDSEIQHLIDSYTSAEASGHYFYSTDKTHPDIKIDDGIYSAIMALHIFDTAGELEAKSGAFKMPKQDKYTLEDFFAAIPRLPVTTDIRDDVTELVKFKIANELSNLAVAAFKDQLRDTRGVVELSGMKTQHPDDGIVEVDGIRLQLKDGSWFLIRASNTSSKLTYKVEAETQERLVDLMREVLKLLDPFEAKGLKTDGFRTELERQQRIGAESRLLKGEEKTVVFLRNAEISEKEKILEGVRVELEARVTDATRLSELNGYLEQIREQLAEPPILKQVEDIIGAVVPDQDQWLFYEAFKSEMLSARIKGNYPKGTKIMGMQAYNVLKENLGKLMQLENKEVWITNEHVEAAKEGSLIIKVGKDNKIIASYRAVPSGGAPEEAKAIYLFGSDMEGNNLTEGSAEMKKELGGKGANLAEMASLGLPVPPGFTITTAQAKKYLAKKEKSLSPELIELIDAYVKRLEEATGKKFGDKDNPLLVSVRSGAEVSMPGMMDTILNIGLNDETVEALAKQMGERFAWDSYRRLIMMFADVVLGLKKDDLSKILEEKKRQQNITSDVELSADALKEVVSELRAYVKEKTGEDFPQDVRGQLLRAIKAVFDSSYTPRAVAYRLLNKIPMDVVSAVNVQSMVFGNLNDRSATGVAFTRNPATGENIFYGEVLINAQGEDVVAGIRTPVPINIAGKEKFIKLHPEFKGREGEILTLEERMPAVYRELANIRTKLEKHYADMQDIEFTIENGKLWMLQTRTGKRTAVAALNILMDLYEEGMIGEEEAVMRLKAGQVEQFLHPIFDPQAIESAKAQKHLLTKGLPASPGAAGGIVVFSSEQAEQLGGAEGRKVILVRRETSPEDIKGMEAAAGILTAIGGMTSHAAVVARGMGKTAVVGAPMVLEGDVIRVGDQVARSGDYISIDGFTGEVFVGEIKTMDSVVLRGKKGEQLAGAEKKLFDRFVKFFEWVNKYRSGELGEDYKLGVRVNADAPEDTRIAVDYFGADGIGLTRTEHMFFKDAAGKEENRILKFRKLILQKEVGEGILSELAEFQKADFVGILRALKGRPATIRLLDPPLHEFLPNPNAEEGRQAIKELSDQLGLSQGVIISRINALKEVSPMAGFRGDRLTIVRPEIARMQVNAMLGAYSELKSEGVDVSPIEIEIPLAGVREEIKEFIPLIEKVGSELNLKRGEDYLIGTMIEIPSAAIMAGDIARDVDFMSFGTNDLTQFTFKFSRDDAGNVVIPVYKKEGVYILRSDSFATIDEFVGELMRIATAAGKKSNPDLVVGICGEHGGDPESVAGTIIPAGLDYTSASPYRVPVVQLAAAQKLITDYRAKRKPHEPYDLRKTRPADIDSVVYLRPVTTEMHMELSDRVNLTRSLILAKEPAAQKKLTDSIAELLEHNFRKMLLANPAVSIRLFNSALRGLFEELRDSDKSQIAKMLKIDDSEIDKRVTALHELNPAMGNRGVRQAFTGYDAIFRAQLKAIARVLKENASYKPKLIVPLLIDYKEFVLFEKIAREVLDEEGVRRDRIELGASIETTRAALQAGEIAKVSDFIIFDTLGLTESVLAITREDANAFLPEFVKRGIYKVNPLEAFPRRNVGRVMGIAIARAQEARPEIPIYAFGPSPEPKPVTRVGINGAGRIGMNLLRAWQERPNDIEVVGINDVAFDFKRQGLKGLVNLVRLLEDEFATAPRSKVQDSVFGYGKDEDGTYWIKINGRRVVVTDEKDPEQLPWDALRVEAVLEATGKFRKAEDASKHIKAGAKRVLITAPGTGKLQTIVPGVNEDAINPEEVVSSCASCTTNAIAPPLKAINDALGIDQFYMVTTHAYTQDQLTLDGIRPSAPQRGRAAAENIVPTTTGAARAISEVIPELKGKGEGIALRVPVSNGSIVGIAMNVSETTTKEQINKLLREASEGRLKGIMAYSDKEDLVSRSILGRSESSIVDGKYTHVSKNGHLVTIWVWYDNEYGYTHRALDLVNLITGKTPPRPTTPRKPIPDEIKKALEAQQPTIAETIQKEATEQAREILEGEARRSAIEEMANQSYLERIESLGVITDRPDVLRQGMWAMQPPEATSYAISPQVAEHAAGDKPLWVMVHSSQLEGPRAAMALKDIQNQLWTVLNRTPGLETAATSAVHFALLADGASSQEEAEKVARAIFDAMPKPDVSNNTIRFSRDAFDVVLPSDMDPRTLLDLVVGTIPGSSVASIVGPEAWVNNIRNVAANRDEIASIVVDSDKQVPDERAIIAAVEIGIARSAAAAGSKLDTALVAKLEMTEEGGLLRPRKPRTYQVEADVRIVEDYKRGIRKAVKTASPSA